VRGCEKTALIGVMRALVEGGGYVFVGLVDRRMTFVLRLCGQNLGDHEPEHSGPRYVGAKSATGGREITRAIVIASR